MVETIFITRAGRGIGLALARECLMAGYKVVATVRGPSGATALTALQDEFPGQLVWISLDVNDASSIAQSLTGDGFHCVDVLVNNAAIFPENGDETLEQLDLDHLSEAFATNVVGVARITRALLPWLKKSPCPRVINISSRAGSISQKNDHAYYAYATSKAALNMITRAMAAEFKPAGIIVVAITPGWVRTEMGGEKAPLSAEESAHSLVEAIRGLTLEQAGCFLDRDGKLLRDAW